MQSAGFPFVVPGPAVPVREANAQASLQTKQNKFWSEDQQSVF